MSISRFNEDKAVSMISNWREISCDDATCCSEAREAADAHFKQLSLHPDSLSQVVKYVLERLPPSSHTALIIRRKKCHEISICLQTLVTLISSKFSLLSSCAEAHLIEVSFKKMNFGLVQLLEDGGSTLCLLCLTNWTYTLFCSSLIIASACSTLFIYFVK